MTKAGRRRPVPEPAVVSARLAVLAAQDAFGRARSYLDKPEGADEGRDFAHLLERVEQVLLLLDACWELLKETKDVDQVPESFFVMMAEVDQLFVDLIVGTFIEERRPVLHGPQETVRQKVRAAGAK